MPLGLVKRLMVEKGFGFILASDGSSDVFFHCSSMAAGEFEKLKEQQAVSYELDPNAAPGDRGPKAKSVAVYHGHVTFTGGDEEFRPLRRHPSARRKKPGWRKSVE